MEGAGSKHGKIRIAYDDDDDDDGSVLSSDDET
jgi:hypothetical protein